MQRRKYVLFYISHFIFMFGVLIYTYFISRQEASQMDNYIMIQYFEWYLPSDQKHWERLGNDADHLASLGVSGVWLPPCSKATSAQDVGYGVYDLYDLGEFDQKNTVATKYGTKAALLDAVSKLHAAGLCVYADVVLNHKAGADETQEISVIEVDQQNRDRDISSPFSIEAWTRFTYPGRVGKYSDFIWGWQHFTATRSEERRVGKECRSRW